MKIGYSPVFVRKFNKLNSEQQSSVKAKVALFKNPVNHKRLGVHKLHGPLAGSYSFSVGYDLRIIFDHISRDEVLFATIGTHKEVY